MTEYVYGRNAVREAVRGPREVREVWATERALAAEEWLREEPGLDHGLRQLLHEQRDPISLGQDLARDLGGQRLIGRDVSQHRFHLPPR